MLFLLLNEETSYLRVRVTDHLKVPVERYFLKPLGCAISVLQTEECSQEECSEVCEWVWDLPTFLYTVNIRCLWSFLFLFTVSRERWSGWVLEDGCTGGANRLVAPFESEKLHLIMAPIFCWGLIWHPSLCSSPWTYFSGRMRNGPPVPDGREDSGVFLTKSFKESVFNSVPHLDTWSSKVLRQFVLDKLIKVF